MAEKAEICEISTSFIEVLAVSYLAKRDALPNWEYMELRKILPKIPAKNPYWNKSV